MGNTCSKVIMLLISVVLLIGFTYSLYSDVNYFVTRKEGRGRIVSAERIDSHDPYDIKLEYENAYLKSNVLANSSVKIQSLDELNGGIGDFIEIYYVKGDEKNVYVKDYNSPRFLIVIFDIFMVLVMVIAVYAYFRSLVAGR